MSYEVTATRRRPRSFDHLAGQEFVVATLKNSIASGRIAHAYLFAGPRGVGKTSAARILAKALNCPDGPSVDGCDDFEGSAEIARGTSLDVIEIDGASNTSVNDVRAIKDEVLFAPNASRYKIYIIDEVHMLSNSAFNALLKTIEEPPPYIIFIFATTEVHKVPATIRSRCQQFNFRLIPLETIREGLAAAATELGIEAETDALTWIAKEATGSLRDAYTLFDQVVAFSDGAITLDKIHAKLGVLGVDALNDLMRAIAAEDVARAIEIVDALIGGGVSVERFVVDLADYLRTLLLVGAGITREAVIGLSAERIPAEIRTAFTRDQLEYGIELVLDLYRDLRYSVSQRFDLELVISRLAGLTRWVKPGELVERIEALQEELVHRRSHELAHPEVPAAPDPAAPSDPDDAATLAPEARYEGVSAEAVERIVASFRTTQISVAAMLARAVRWSFADETLTIRFADRFGAGSLVEHREAIERAAAAELGVERLRVVTATETTPGGGDAAVDPNAEMVRRVFRGEIVEDES